MWQIEYFLRGCFTHSFQNLKFIRCHVYVSHASEPAV
jgi:hypothetical protein